MAAKNEQSTGEPAGFRIENRERDYIALGMGPMGFAGRDSEMECFREGYCEAFDDSFRIGFFRGLHDAKLEIAGNLLSENVPIEFIVRSTGLSEREIAELRQD